MLTLWASSCAIGPNYHRPAVPTPQTYKETAGWKPATPKDLVDRGAWWLVYGDSQLDRLERQVSISNQNIKVYQAQYAAAQALVREARSQLFPGLSASGAATPTCSTSSSCFPNTSQYQVQATATWTLDVWGSIRRQLESQKAAAQVSAADLANALLSAQTTLAQDYFQLRESDSLEDLLTAVVKDYEGTTRITQNQYKFGVASRGDYMSALAQLQSTQAQRIAVREARGQYEHAIAVLTGALPSEFAIAHDPLPTEVPIVPVGLPSTLLERNPNIAAAERQMKSENALIGVAEATYFPTITLSGLGGYLSASLANLFTTANRLWSAGASGSETVFNAGYRPAAVAAARANYEAAVASYRQTVLSTFQSVEDQLVALHTLQDESVAAAEAVDSAKQASDVALNEYKAGIVPFTTVLVTDEAYLTDRQAFLTIQQNRFLASVALIEALGGGWDSSKL